MVGGETTDSAPDQKQDSWVCPQINRLARIFCAASKKLTAATNDPEIPRKKKKENYLNVAKSPQTNTADTNERAPPPEAASVRRSRRLVEVLIGAVAKHVWRNVHI